MKNFFKLFTIVLIIAISLNFASGPGLSQSEYSSLVNYDYKVLPLPGSLNDVPVFNSNSPEIIKTEGILLSTFPPENKEYPEAHLNMPFNGRFDIFTHHIALEREKGDFTNLYQGILLQNPGTRVVTLKILTSATYTTRPDSPFINLPDYLKNSNGTNYSGPGDRTCQDILRIKNLFNNTVIRINPGDFFILMNESIPISPLSASNGRTSLFKLDSDGPLHVADLALYEKDFLFWKDQKPELKDWLFILKTGRLAEKRDNIPSPLDLRYEGSFYYGRVAGVSVGSTWKAKIENDVPSGNEKKFNIPAKNKGVVYVLNTLFGNTYATAQVQSGTIVKRYPDSAYQSNGNYGVTYEIEIPLFNSNKEATSVTISFDTPIRYFKDRIQPYLSYFENPPDRIAFRGEFLVQYKSYLGIEVEKFIHVVQRFGQQGLPLVSLFMDPGERRLVKITYIYPPDSTPPHVFTITSN